MTFIEVGTYVIDVEKILYVQLLTQTSIDIYFDKDVKIRITGQDSSDFLDYLRGNK